MAETATEIYQAFCEEATLLTASIASLEAAPTLATLDELSAARVRLGVVQQALPALCAAHERYETAERTAALVALHAPRWSAAAATKRDALATIASLLSQLTSAVTAYTNAHGAQLATLAALPMYSGPYRAQYAVAPASLKTIIATVTGGDASWLSRVRTFDPLGVSPALPTE